MKVECTVRGFGEQINIYRYAVTQLKTERGATDQTEWSEFGQFHQLREDVAQ
jgi:hypothetical protein